MSQTKTKIEWADSTWNPVTGCDRTSPGCDHCYALTMAARLKAMGSPRYQNDGDPRTSGPGFGVTLHPDALDQPLRWQKARRIFVNSMSDLFHPDVPNAFIRSVWETMAGCPQHTFQILTKRPLRMRWRASEIACDAGRVVGHEPHNDSGLMLPVVEPAPLPNVWLGTSIENDRYTFRANHLRNTPAAIRFLSLEPLLGPLPSLDLTGIDWVIVGGESGPDARPMHPDWVRDIRDRCVAAGAPFFFKQWGEWAVTWDSADDPDWRKITHLTAAETNRRFLNLAGGHGAHGERVVGVSRLGKKAAGRVLDGRTWDEYPA